MALHVILLRSIIAPQAVAVTSIVRQSLPPGKMITIGNLEKDENQPLEGLDQLCLTLFPRLSLERSSSLQRHVPSLRKTRLKRTMFWNKSGSPCFSVSLTLMSAASKPAMSTDSWFLSTCCWISSRDLKWSPSGLQ